MTDFTSFQQFFGFLLKVYTTTAVFLRQSFFTPQNLSYLPLFYPEFSHFAHRDRAIMPN